MRAAQLGFFAELRTMAWLKSREMLGERRSPLRLWLILLGVSAWTLLLYWGSSLAYQEDPSQALPVVAVLATALWPLWAVVPLAGGGAGEVTSSARLAPYPVSPRAQMLGALLSAFTDFPFLVGFPVLVALSGAAAGVLGVLVASSFALGAACLGQLGAWSSALFFAGRSRPSVGIVVPVVVLVSALIVLPYLLPSGSTLGEFLPGAWASGALGAAVRGDVLLLCGWVSLLLLPILVFVRWGPPLVAHALDAKASAPGEHSHPWRGPGRLSSPFALVVKSTLRSTLRAASTQAAIVGALAAPFLVQLPLNGSSASIPMETLGLFACLAAGASLTVNVFAFDAGGSLMLLSSPISSYRLMLAKGAAGVVVITALQWVVLLVAFLLGDDPASTLLTAILLAPVQSLIVVSVGLRWSARYPLAVDVESMRNKITTPWAVIGYMATCTFLIVFLEVSRRLMPPIGVALVLLVCLLVSALWWLLASLSMSREGRVRVSTTAR